MNIKIITCMLCNATAQDISNPSQDGICIKCPNCGKYCISRSAQALWKEKVQPNHLPILIENINEKRDNEKEPTLFSSDIEYL